jgi:hypothetical protein
MFGDFVRFDSLIEDGFCSRTARTCFTFMGIIGFHSILRKNKSI